MLALDVKIQNEKGLEDTMHIVAKAVPRNEFIQKMFKTPLTFKKELEFYRTVVPTLREFQKDHALDVMDFFPEFYGGRLGQGLNPDLFDNDAVILLENLKLCFDLDGAKFILKSLAAFHAIPLALKFKKPEVFKKSVLPFINNVKAFDSLGKEIVYTVIDGIVKLAEENKKCVPLLSGIKSGMERSYYFTQNPSPPREPFATLIHCDLWVNNTMVKMDENKVIGNKFVDFQLTEYGSPARDLIFFVFDSIQNNVVVNYFDDLVEFYHQNFTDILCKFNIDIGPFSLKNFREEIDITINEHVFFQCFIMLKPIFAEDDSIKEIDNMSEDDMTDDGVISQKFREKLWMITTEFANRHWL
ncbi:hypothetical protein NQ314_016068 [Rhamnusium bicolor]|uniref:CHK kinase-like domain-containing protein n=1 Tax=Rhamnusium bicolor TaxID=1586634 RepID=A0AAV8WY59_9CUCU|nr:hypothetical protein NQ314_016068 [Rhamnusium bicolor]